MPGGLNQFFWIGKCIQKSNMHMRRNKQPIRRLTPDRGVYKRGMRDWGT